MSREWRLLDDFYCQCRETDTSVAFLALTLEWSRPHPRKAFFSSLTTKGGSTPLVHMWMTMLGMF